MRVFDRLLVVDFDERSLLETTALFEQHGFDVVPAGSIDDVLRALEPGAPRVIVMEPILPDRDGFELCRSMLDSCIGFKPIVVMASTRITGHEPHFRAKDVGAHMFIERPKQDEMLIQAVTTVMQAGGSGADPSVTGRDDEPAPVLDPSFADWVERTFTPGATGERATAGSSDQETDDDTLCLDALGGFDGGVATAELSSVVEISPDTALAVANRASIVVSDAMRPAPEPRRWGGVLAVGLAVVLTVGGAIAWFAVGRRGSTFEGMETAPAGLPTRGPAINVSNIPLTGSAAPASVALERFDEPDDTTVDAMIATVPLERPFTDETAGSDLPSAVGEDEPATPAVVAPPETLARPARAEPATIESSTGDSTAPSVTAVPAAAIDAPAEIEPITTPAATTDDDADEITTAPELRAALDPLGANPETAAAPGLSIGWNGARPGSSRPVVVPEIAPAPVPPPIVIVEPSLMQRVAPRYPLAARRWGRGGRVMLRAIVGTDGALREIEVVDEPVRQLGFGRAALDAVRHWQYRPATIDGVPIERPISIEVNFRP